MNDAEMEAWLRRRTVDEPPPLPPEGVILVAYDASWPALFAVLESRIRRALGEHVRRIEHVGSTSVPGLRAKPIIDIALAVADTTDEAAYVPQLEGDGFQLRVREPEWYEHRLFKHPDPACNLHVFNDGCPEIERNLLFRDCLRAHPEERELYERTKLELAQRPWRYMQQYADAKSDVVAAIIERARRAP